MGVIPYTDTSVEDNGSWDGPAEVASIPNTATADTLRKMYAWVDPNGNPDAKSSYKFPHHKVKDGTPGAADVAGVRAALSRVPQADIPEGDRAGVQSHLNRHLDKFKISQGKSSMVIDDVMIVGAVEIFGRTWAVRPETLDVLSRLHGARVSKSVAEDLESMAIRGSAPMVRGATAIVPLKGVITPRASLLAMLFGMGGGLDQFKQSLQAAVADPDVSSIVIDVDSPGGMVDQVPETAQVIRDAAQAKPITAVSNTMTASAAYWLASQASEVVVTPSGEAGSIGVYQIHKDVSQALEMDGVKPTVISAGKYKTDGNPFEPLSDSAREAAQSAVDDYYGMFVADVAKGRGAKVSDVKNGYGEGRSLLAKRAVEAGLADRVDTLEGTVARVARGRRSGSGSRAAEEEGAGVSYTAEERDRLLAVVAGLNR